MLHDHLPRFNSANFATPHRDAFGFYWEELGPGGHLILSCKSFRQEKAHSVEVLLELVTVTPPKAQVEAVVTATNLKGDVRGRLLVDVDRVATPFDDAYGLSGRNLAIRPPVDLPDNLEDTRDYTWYCNGGFE